MTMENKELLSANDLYSANIDNWRFLNHSYLGGRLYKQQNYLTRYVYETEDEYRQRAVNTPLDNHCASIVNIYNSFIFAEPPTREFGSIENSPYLAPFLEDADYDGRSFDDFMSEADRMSSIYGSCWIVIDKPSVETTNRAEEITQGIRPYVSLFAPTAVLDWSYKRQINGAYELDYLKVIEAESKRSKTIKIFTREIIETYEVEERGKPVLIDSMPNPLGYIPAVCVYDVRSADRGIGISAIEGPADVQRAIFDENSEIEQLIRITNHPSLVLTREVKANAGAGSVIVMDESLDPGLKPYLLQPNGGNLDAIRAAITDKVDAINRMANVGAIRVTETKQLSGVAMETEFRLLEAKLANKAQQLELAEESIWQIFCSWIDGTWDGVVEYNDSYNTRDKMNDLAVMKQSLDLMPANEALKEEIARQVAEIISDDPEVIDSIIRGYIDGTTLPIDTIESSTTTMETP